jgi:DNA polymerase I-like protein with 3'-5' exonuclease and polymerase domains
MYESGCRRNFYGRPIWNINELQENKLINNYIQSTAVDTALLYFSELCDILNLDSCKPVFIIHDALIVDVKNDYVEELTKIINLGYNCPQLGNFPLEIKKLSETF